jgi:cellobiose-specific phosphotransferase system component IIC
LRNSTKKKSAHGAGIKGTALERGDENLIFFKRKLLNFSLSMFVIVRVTLYEIKNFRSRWRVSWDENLKHLMSVLMKLFSIIVVVLVAFYLSSSIHENTFRKGLLRFSVANLIMSLAADSVMAQFQMSFNLEILSNVALKSFLGEIVSNVVLEAIEKFVSSFRSSISSY